MQNKALRPNVLPVQVVGAGATVTSQTETNTWGRGIRLYVTIGTPTATGTLDSIFLCGVPPLSTTPVRLVGFTAVNLLTVAGTICFDFYPGGWLPTVGIAPNGAVLGVAGIHLPTNWAVAVVMGAGNTAIIRIHAEILP